MCTTSAKILRLRILAKEAGIYLRRQVDLAGMELQESLLSRKRTDCDNALKELSEVREDRTAGIRLHSPQVSTSVEVADSELPVEVAEYGRWNNE